MSLPIVQNYHKHTDDTNPIIMDSSMTYDMLAKRTIECGGKILSSVAHGWQGRYHICWETAQKYGLKFIFGTECYWVKNRHEKDNTNAHLIILAKNENGMEDINEILSIANEDGFYYRARVDLDLIFNKLTPSDAFITSSCIAGWKYDDIEDIWLKMYYHFGDNFMLEIQNHNTLEQKTINQKIVKLHKKYGIKMIVGLDSHFIRPNQTEDRNDLLASKHIKYHEAETDWYMEYPTNEEIYDRFIKQGIFTSEEIIEAMQNTNVILDFEDINFDRSMKLPTIYPKKTQEEKNDLFKQIINNEFKKFIKENNIKKEKIPKYIKAVQEEAQVILNTNMADYFLLNYEIIKKGKEYGGVTTPSGRGSSGGFLLNTLFGFSSMDRLSSSIKLFPERFLTEDRVKAGSLVDIDFNLSDVRPFIKAQKEVMGENYAYPMLAMGTVKAKSGFKMYARSQNLDFDIANEISKQIDTFEKDYKNASDEDREHINIYDYIGETYHSYIKASESYLGIVVDKKIAPCSHILYSDKDIRRKIGVIRLTNKTTKTDLMVACIEGHVADRFGYLKNDLLKVEVLHIISEVYKKINIPIHTTNQLTNIVENDDKVWDIYKNGLTICVNQCESEATTNKVMKYQPKNISEMTAFIAAIRPSFKSMYSTFESRKPFTYGIKAFDDLIQTPQMPNSFILYQEQLMQTFNFAGFPITECYSIIKAVAKKKPEKLMQLKTQFREGFSLKIKEVQPELTNEQVENYCNKVWQIAEDSANYSFNASHALAYAYDSLYCAYLKSHYPYEFYTIILELYSNKGEKDRVKEIIKEMKKGFGIELGEYKFGVDNRQFVANKENNKINANLRALKSIGKNTPEELYNIPKDIDNFIDLLIYIREKTSIKKNEISILIKIDYFDCFGGGNKLLKIYEEFYKVYSKTNSQKTKDKKRENLLELFKIVPNKIFTTLEKIRNDIEYLGETSKFIPHAPNDIYMVINMELNYGNYTIDLLRICDAEIIKVRISESDFKLNTFIKLAILKNVKLYKTKYGNIKLNNYSICIENKKL